MLISKKRGAKMWLETSLPKTSSDSFIIKKLRVSKQGLQLLPLLHMTSSSLLCHLCNTKSNRVTDTSMQYTITDLNYKEETSLSLNLTFHKLSSCQRESVRWGHCVKMIILRILGVFCATNYKRETWSQPGSCELHLENNNFPTLNMKCRVNWAQIAFTSVN